MTSNPMPRTTPTPEQMRRHLLRANEVAKRAVSLGRHPFGCLLVGPDNETVLFEHGNIDTVNHAESTLARIAASNYAPDYLWGCTLYTSVEPCVMCAGTIYWANIGRVVFAMTEHDLLACTGSHEENPTLDLPCRVVFEHGQKAIDVIGPLPDLAPEVAAVQRTFWAQR